MLAYQKPVCDCGEELNYEVDEIQTMTYKVLKNGNISKRPISQGGRAENNFGRLVCPECHREFEYNAFIRGPYAHKAIRGKEM